MGRNRGLVRERGEHWRIWKVCGRDRTTGKRRCVGYLTTEQGPFHKPLRFVEGVNAKSLKVARRNLRVERRKNVWAWQVSFDRWRGYLMFPVGRSGRIIANNKGFAAIRYATDSKLGRVTCMLTHYGVRLMEQG